MPSLTDSQQAAGERNCPLCPRLAAFRESNRRQYPDFFNAPVPSFGPENPRLLVVGLAPGLKGANRTGRPFTGDFAGGLLYGSLLHHGFATGIYRESPDDGVELVDCRITNAVRCVPPQNKPEGKEPATCRPLLVKEIKSAPRLEAILALGVVAHNAVLSALGLKLSTCKFAHGAIHKLPKNGILLFDTYHSSRYNVNTGRLTEKMFDDVVKSIRERM